MIKCPAVAHARISGSDPLADTMTPQTEMVYLDYAGACPVLSEVIDAHPGLCARYIANPHGTTGPSNDAKTAIWRAEREIFSATQVQDDEARLIWTGGGTEADNLAILGLRRSGAPFRAVVDAGAHPAVIEPARHLCKETGGDLVLIPLGQDGTLALDRVDHETAAPADLVAVSHVNNETGAITDLVALRRWMKTHSPDARLLVDGMQAFGRIPLPWMDARIDLLTLSARKLGGPASVGMLLVRRNIELKPLLYGGGQQHSVRPGTLDTVGIVETAIAAKVACGRSTEERARIASINRFLREQLQRWTVPTVQLISPPEACPHILSLSLPGYEGAVVMRLLAEKGVIVGTGSACSAESNKPSQVLTAMNLPDSVARGLLRISMGWQTTSHDARRFLAELAQVVREY